MTTKEAEAILELAGRYFRNQWAPGASSEESRETILEAARVLLDGELAELTERVEKAEAAARDFAEALADIAGAKGVRWGPPEVHLIANDALASHPDFLPGETGERYPPKP